MFTGTYTAIVTPFKNGNIDEAALERLIRIQIRGGVDGIVPVGTTGESPTVNYEEHIHIIALSVKFARGQIKVLAGTGGNSTSEAIYLTEEAERASADGSLQVAPYYNKPPQEGLFQHFREVAWHTKLPIVLYSIPSRCGIEIAVDTVRRLARECKTVTGIKEAGGNPDRVSQLRAALGPHFEILSGDDGLTLSNYHAGQTSDLLTVLRERVRAAGPPMFLIGYSLGGNVALKLTGELGEEARDLLAGVCAVSVPIDLAACAAALERPSNYLYQDRFVRRLKDRIRRRHTQAPHLYTLEHLPKIRTITDFDNCYTAPLFGFGTAANYFRTQSSNQFLERIRIRTLVVQAKDDPLIPFEVFDHPAFSQNPHLRLEAVEHGGHLGFLSRRPPRFWLDHLLLGWVEEIVQQTAAAAAGH